MTCRELIEFLMDYLDGKLAGEEIRSFDSHLAQCPECTDYLASYKITVKLGHQVCRDLDGGVPPEVPDDLVAAILEARRAGSG